MVYLPEHTVDLDTGDDDQAEVLPGGSPRQRRGERVIEAILNVPEA